MADISLITLLWPAILAALKSFAIAWPVGTAVLNVILRAKTAEAWIARCEQYPRFAAFTRLIRAVGLDPIKMAQAIGELGNAGK